MTCNAFVRFPHFLSVVCFLFFHFFSNDAIAEVLHGRKRWFFYPPNVNATTAGVSFSTLPLDSSALPFPAFRPKLTQLQWMTDMSHTRTTTQTRYGRNERGNKSSHRVAYFHRCYCVFVSSSLVCCFTCCLSCQVSYSPSVSDSSSVHSGHQRVDLRPCGQTPQ